MPTPLVSHRRCCRFGLWQLLVEQERRAATHNCAAWPPTRAGFPSRQHAAPPHMPAAYFIRGVCINEMTSPDWGTPLAGSTVGDLVLANR